MVDKTLLANFANAARARPILRLLPDGPRQHCLQYEQMCLEDIRAQSGNPNITESEIMDMVPSATSKIITAVLPVAGEIVVALVKKYLPTVAASGAVSAIATYLATK